MSIVAARRMAMVVAVLAISVLAASPVIAGNPRSLGLRDSLAPVVGADAKDVIRGK